MKTRLHHLPSLAAAALAVFFAGCGPADTGADDDTPCDPQATEVCDDGHDNNCDSKVDCDDADCATNSACVSCVPIAERCDDLLDNDCDNIIDCEDADCEGNPVCPASTCGTLEHPTGSFALPDEGCPEDLSLPCPGFENTLNFTGFSAGQTLTDISKLLGVCVKMEHSWMRDLVIKAKCPNGTEVILSGFAGHTGGEVYIGEPNDFDNGQNPIPGVGWDYCWTPAATDAAWIPYANAHSTEHTLHSGDYQASSGFNAFVGCPLNGGWTLRVEDRWGIDNGFIFEWSVRFDPSLVADCENWPD